MFGMPRTSFINFWLCSKKTGKLLIIHHFFAYFTTPTPVKYESEKNRQRIDDAKEGQ